MSHEIRLEFAFHKTGICLTNCMSIPADLVLNVVRGPRIFFFFCFDDKYGVQPLFLVMEIEGVRSLYKVASKV